MSVSASLCCELMTANDKGEGAFQLYDINHDGLITFDEMHQIVQSIYDMTGEMVKLPADEDTAQKVRSSFRERASKDANANPSACREDLQHDGHEQGSPACVGIHCSSAFSSHLLEGQSRSRSSKKARRRTQPSSRFVRLFMTSRLAAC